jgi:DNA-binding Lrp family transcriptional regulator
MSSALLLDEPCLVIQPVLVRALGHVLDAAVLQQLHYWMQRAQSRHEGFTWVWKTYEEWSDEIGVTPKQVRTAIERLEARGVVRSCQPESWNRRKWYRVDYSSDVLYEDSASAHLGSSICPTGQVQEPKQAVPSAQQGASNTEITTEITTEISKRESDDSFRLAELLADLIESNGSKRPVITKRWTQAIDRMIRLDGRTPEQIEKAMRWSQANDFWRGNIMSPEKLRKQYDRMRLQAMQEQKSGGAKGLAGVRDFLADLDNR